MANTYIIYKATSPTGKVYIGLTSQSLDARISGHFRRARSVLPGSHFFCDALRKYGTAMIWTVLESGEGAEWASAREKHHIAAHRSQDRAFGYNLTCGGQCIPDKARLRLALTNPSLATRLRMSFSAKRRGMSPRQLANLRAGRVSRPHTDASKARMRAAHLGKALSTTTRLRMSQAKKGVPHTSSHKEALRMAQARPVLRSDGRPFLSARHASLEMGASTGDSVGKALRNHGSCGGFTFIHISEVEYVDAIVAWEAKVAAGHQEQQPVWSMSRKGLKHTDEARANMARAKKGKERSPEHTRNHRAAISSPVIRSDGVRFLSIRDAAQAMGLTSAQITYSIKEGFPRQGFTFGFDR